MTTAASSTRSLRPRAGGSPRTWTTRPRGNPPVPTSCPQHSPRPNSWPSCSPRPSSLTGCGGFSPASPSASPRPCSPRDRLRRRRRADRPPARPQPQPRLVLAAPRRNPPRRRRPCRHHGHRRTGPRPRIATARRRRFLHRRALARLLRGPPAHLTITTRDRDRGARKSRSRLAGRAASADPQAPLDAGVRGDSGDDGAGLAPPPPSPAKGPIPGARARLPTGHGSDHETGRLRWPGRTLAGSSPDPGPARPARSHDRALDCVKILKLAEIDAAPERSGPAWSEFLPTPPGCPALSGCRAGQRARRTTAIACRPEAARTGLDDPAHHQVGLPGRLDHRRHARRSARPGGRHSHAGRPSGRYGYWPAACSTKTSRRKPMCDVCHLRVSVRAAN